MGENGGGGRTEGHAKGGGWGEGMKLLGVKSWLTPFLVCFVGPGTCCCNPTGAPQTRAQRNLRFGHPPHSVPLVFPFALLAVPVLLLCSFGACFLFCFSHSHHHTHTHRHTHTPSHRQTDTHPHSHHQTHTQRPKPLVPIRRFATRTNIS